MFCHGLQMPLVTQFKRYIFLFSDGLVLERTFYHLAFTLKVAIMFLINSINLSLCYVFNINLFYLFSDLPPPAEVYQKYTKRNRNIDVYNLMRAVPSLPTRYRTACRKQNFHNLFQHQEVRLQEELVAATRQQVMTYSIKLIIWGKIYKKPTIFVIDNSY